MNNLSHQEMNNLSHQEMYNLAKTDLNKRELMLTGYEKAFSEYLNEIEGWDWFCPSLVRIQINEKGIEFFPMWTPKSIQADFQTLDVESVVTLGFTVAPAAGAYTVVIVG